MTRDTRIELLEAARQGIMIEGIVVAVLALGFVVFINAYSIWQQIGLVWP